MRLHLRAAARAFGGRSIPGFHSIEEFLGLASLIALVVLLLVHPASGRANDPGIDPDPGRGIGRIAGPAGSCAAPAERRRLVDGGAA